MEYMEELTACYKTYSPMLFRLAMAQLGNRAEAEDIVQEVFLKRMARRSFSDAEHEKRWLIRVTVNLCHNLQKSAPRTRQVSLEDAMSAAAPENAELRMQVEALLSGLEPDTRAIFHLHYYEGYTLSEIAELLHLRLSTVKMRLKRGRDRLEWEDS